MPPVITQPGQTGIWNIQSLKGKKTALKIFLLQNAKGLFQSEPTHLFLRTVIQPIIVPNGWRRFGSHCQAIAANFTKIISKRLPVSNDHIKIRNTALDPEIDEAADISGSAPAAAVQP